MIRSGELPDIVGGTNLRSLFNQFGPQGAFLPLDDLIRDHAPNLRRFLDERPEMRKTITAYDGKLYYVPFFPDGKLATAYFIRQDWLDRLGLKTPQTVDEFYSVLQAFKTGDPNRNGLNDEVPFFAADLCALLRLLPLWDARSSGSHNGLDFYISGNRIAHGLAEPSYRIAARNLAQWYREGLINDRFYMNGGPERDFLLRNDLGGATNDWFAPTSTYNDFLPAKIPGFRFVPMLPPASASGARKEEGRRAPVENHGWAISYRNRNAIETIRYFDFWFSPEGRRLQNFGLEGIHYDMIGDRPVFRAEVLRSETPVVAQLRAQGALMPRGTHEDYAYEAQWTNQIAREGIRQYENGDYEFDYYLPAALNEAEQSVVDLYWPRIRTLMHQKAISWVTGQSDVDMEWEAYLRELEQLGLAEVLEALNTAHWRELNRR